MIRPHPHTGPHVGSDRGWHVVDVAETPQADLCDHEPSAVAAERVDARVDHACSAGQRVHADTQHVGIGRHVLRNPPGALVQAQAGATHSPPHWRISPLPSSAKSPEYRSYLPPM